MPTPHDGESEKDFVARCVPMVIADGAAEDGAQGAAVCHSMYREHKKAARSAESYRSLQVEVPGAMLRLEEFEGREYLVVPVVALVGGIVVESLGSDGPELVPTEVLADAPGQWNGRPVTLGHPGGTASANTPQNLERYRIGWTFNARLEDGRLKLEAWIDPERVAALGADAEGMVRRLQAGEVVDVSVGAVVRAVAEDGVVGGKRYVARWTSIRSDHLATLPDREGACSVAAGCGAGRAAEAAEQPTEETPMAREGKTIAARLRGAFAHLRALAMGDGVSSHELMQRLGAALFKTEPAFAGIADVYPDSKTVIYSTCPDDEFINWRRSYEVGADGEVTLGDDAVRVEQSVEWKAVEAEAAPDGTIDGAQVAAGDEPDTQKSENAEPEAARAACGCEQVPKGEAMAAQPVTEGGSTMSEKLKELAGRLIGCTRLKFQESDRAMLESLGEEKLEALDALRAAPPAAPAPDPNVVTLTRADHARVLTAANAYFAQQERAKADLVAGLETAQAVYAKAELEALDVAELEKLAALAKVQRPNFSGRSAAPAAPEPVVAKAPDGWALSEKGAN